MDFYGFPSISKNFHGFPWISMDFHRFPWTSMDFHGLRWKSMHFHGLPWTSSLKLACSAGSSISRRLVVEDSSTSRRSCCPFLHFPIFTILMAVRNTPRLWDNHQFHKNHKNLENPCRFIRSIRDNLPDPPVASISRETYEIPGS